MKRAIFSLFSLALVFALFAPAAALADTGSGPVNSNEDAATSITSEDAAFGLSDVQRSQVGMKKTYEGTSYGYVFSLGKDARGHFSVIATDESVIVYAPKDAADAAGFNLENKSQQEAFISMLETLDDELSDGGVKLSSLDLPFVFTSETSYKQGDATFTFDTEIEPGYFYTTCTVPGAESYRNIAQFCLSGQLLPRDQVVVEEQGGWFEQIVEFLSPENMDYRPLWVSLKTAGVAMVFIFILGLLAAKKAMHVKSRWKGLFDSIFTIPMVLPPTVVGFILLVIFGNSTPFGRFLIDHGIELVFSWPAAVIAATVVGFPLMYRTVLGAFESLDVNMLDAARTLGWSEGRIFRKLMLPLAWPSIASGIVLAFARAMGEFGATLFVAGNYAGITQTMPIAIYFSWMGGNSPVAVFWVVVVIVISFVIILFINLYTAHAQRYRRAGGKASKDEPIAEEGEVSFVIDEQAAATLGFGTSEGKNGMTAPVSTDGEERS